MIFARPGARSRGATPRGAKPRSARSRGATSRGASFSQKIITSILSITILL